MHMSDRTNFKSCPSCEQSWESREDFLSDASLKLVGYQVHFKDLEEGLFLFNHSSCKSTIAIQSGKFSSLYDGPIFTTNRMHKEDCPDHCLSKFNLETCPVQCECNYVREIMQIIKTWEKNES
jgi:hypothetical protein